MDHRMELRRYRIAGRVQGVGFRGWTRRVAGELEVVGRVWNERDGTVEVRARGTLEALDRLETALWNGPPAARVESVLTEDLGSAAADGAEAVWDSFAIEH